MYTQHKIVVGFIIYKPENSFIERLKKTVVDGFKIYIFDNSPEESNVRDFCLGRKEIKYLTVGKNVGLGLGISSICAQAYYEGNSALVFFDQDTVFQSETLSFIDNYHMNHEILEATYSAVVFGASNSLIAGGADCFQDVNVAINSGSLFFLRNLKNIGWHNETYRIFQKTFILRAYPLFRVLDTLKSSCKLLLSALLSLEFRFAAMILKFASVFMVVQLLSRFLKPVK
jgi:rhamnosyltransferase